MRRILVLPPLELQERLFAPPVRARLDALGEITANPTDRNYTGEELAEMITGVEACLASWGSPKFTPEVMERADSLRIISYAAGSVKGIVTPAAFERGVTVCTSQPAMAISVAAMTVAMMEIMLRNVVGWATAIRSKRTWRPEGVAKARELSGKVVGIIGASLIGREVIRFLGPFDVEIWVCDPYLSAEEAVNLGVQKVGLEEIFPGCDVITVHAPLTDETRGMIRREHLRLIKDGAVLINTSRGAIIDHEALLEELRTGRFTAALDVTDPEPLPEGHELFGLENVVFTPHISGGTPEMVRRQGELAIRNLELFFSGGTPTRLVTAEMLEHIA
jgi:phosphoglycerate dehydrogenase-like enzyme